MFQSLLITRRALFLTKNLVQRYLVGEPLPLRKGAGDRAFPALRFEVKISKVIPENEEPVEADEEEDVKSEEEEEENEQLN